MWPDRVSNPGPLTYESVALPTALRGPALKELKDRTGFLLLQKDRNDPKVIKLFPCSAQLSMKF